MTEATLDTTDALLADRDIADLLKISRATVYTIRNRDRSFPVPVRGPFRGTRWRSSEIQNWIKALPHVGDPPLGRGRLNHAATEG